MSSACCGFRPTDDKSKLRAQLYLTTPNRAWTERLTFFNESGHAHAKDGLGGSTVTALHWSRDGRKIWFERPFYGANGRALGWYLMELTFAGACGATPAAGSPRPGRSLNVGTVGTSRWGRTRPMGSVLSNNTRTCVKS